MAVTAAQLDEILDKVYEWGRVRGWQGYNKHDGLNSPLLNATLGWSRWPRLVAIQGVMRMPINIRPLLMVRPTRNPKGLSLLARGLFHRYAAAGGAAGGGQGYLEEGLGLLELLGQDVSVGSWSGLGWGYPYPWQDGGFFAPTNTPNAVVTSFVCEAFLDGYEVTRDDRHLETVAGALDFLLTDLPVLLDDDRHLCLGYQPVPMTMRVMDVSILIGAVAARFGVLSGNSKWQEKAQRLVRYVVEQQTPEGAWYYTDPPSASHVKIDNYHTGFILDALERYMAATGDRAWQKSYDKGLDFYARHLFNPDHSPRWRSDCDYPHDIHGAAQGILTFSRHWSSHGELAQGIADWALSTMYHPEGRFFYQEAAWFKKRFTLLRWCNGWMALALATLHRAKSESPPT
ncbi:MAG: hypothetical protein HQL52_00840 [Magnetococcales bacterium]|nr:hypothetical protein [Magnetococcales bacterium]